LNSRDKAWVEKKGQVLDLDMPGSSDTSFQTGALSSSDLTEAWINSELICERLITFLQDSDGYSGNIFKHVESSIMPRILILSLEDIVNCSEQSSIRASLKTIAKSLNTSATRFIEDDFLPNTTKPPEYKNLDIQRYINGLSSILKDSMFSVVF
jgi:hypothetical protein